MHVENVNLTTTTSMPHVLRWWCGVQGHASEPLCVRHEISRQIALTQGAERRQLQQHRQSLLADGLGQELTRALSAYCNESLRVAGDSALNSTGTGGLLRRVFAMLEA